MYYIANKTIPGKVVIVTFKKLYDLNNFIWTTILLFKY